MREICWPVALVSLPGAVINYSDKGDLKGKIFVLAYSLRLQSIMTRESKQQEPASQMTSIVSKLT